jgi:hypothetical protein
MPHTVKPWMAMAFMALGSALCLPVGAQSMYRCGNTYQAYPCETGQGKVIGSTGSQQSSYQPVPDADCAQRGAESLKIVWRREAGLTRDKALAEVDDKPLSAAQKTEAKKLVNDVYHRRGSAPEVRAAIEAECVTDKEREARAAAMYRGANQPGPQQVSPDPASRTAGKPNAGTADGNRKEQGLAMEPVSKKTRCENFNRQLDDISRRQRAGGDMAAMEQLRQDQRDLQRDMSESGC